MTTRQKIKQRWTGRSHAGEATRDQEIQEIKEKVRDILASGDEIAIGRLDRTVRVLGTAARIRASGYQPRFFYGQHGQLRAVVIDGKGKSPKSAAPG